MWNHSSTYSVSTAAPAVEDGNLDVNSNVNFVDKVEKHFDLTNYLKFVQTIFERSTSDSGESDEEPGAEGKNEFIKLSKFLSSVGTESTNSSSSNSETTRGPSQSRKNRKDGLRSPHSLPSLPKECSSDSSSSTSSSSFSSDEEDASSMLPSDLTPMSDLELNNLLKKTNYMGPDADSMAFELDDTTTDSEKKKHIKKKKKKAKKKHDDGNNQRQNKPNSGGKGNGPNGGFSGFGGDSGGPGADSTGNSNSTGSSNLNSGRGSTSTYCNSRARKQSLKIIRAEAAASSCSSGEMSLKDVQIESVLNGSEILRESSPSPVTSNISLNAEKVVFSGVLERKSEATLKKKSDLPSAVNECMKFATPYRLRICDSDYDGNDDDDNDSLSDYVSMAATAAASTAQVPPLHQQICNSGYEFLQFHESTSNGSYEGKSTKSSIQHTTDFNHQAVQSRGKEQRKRKADTKIGKLALAKQTKPLVQKQAEAIELLNIKRRQVYVFICKKEIPKTQRSRVNAHKETLMAKRRLAQACTRFCRQQAIQSQRVMKESVWKAKRLTREMQAFWKQTDRVEREERRRKEKEAEEQRKLDFELMEAKRQQRKLNFLITQTELYAHFMTKKLCKEEVAVKEEDQILSRLNEQKNERLAKIDNYDGEELKFKAKENVLNALQSQQSQVKRFDIDANAQIKNNQDTDSNHEYEQSNLFDGTLKYYQLKGKKWLINLYDQGINGILADEMGLGKTVQSIAFLAHIAEKYGVWGPFLIVAPASTLHNWQQELKRFVKDFKVVPYWGTPQERKILRQFWQQNKLHTPGASFHVVVTSYQMVTTDLKYFNKIKWQYLILDEAQAIKSTSSARWKMLKGFNCRSRLLLTGTPIQNTMGELWALLHFIMPSLFDSLDEFSEWFSKDIESHAEKKTLMDEKHLSRLHLILKPFMLRRIKKDVENELSEKIEIQVSCPLTSKQLMYYTALKRKINVEDVLRFSGPSNSPLAQSATTNLMNLMMQFRKVCNHPDLFERRELKSPFHMKKAVDTYPKLIFRDGILARCVPSKLHILENKFCIFHPENTHRSLFHRKNPSIAQKLCGRKIKVEDIHVDSLRLSNTAPSEWSFLRLLGISSGDMWNLYCDGILERFRLLVRFHEEIIKIHLRSLWRIQDSGSFHGTLETFSYPDWKLSFPSIACSPVLQNLVFTSATGTFYKWMDHRIKCIPESLEHRVLRSRKAFPSGDPSLVSVIPHKHRQPEIRILQSTLMPTFLYNLCPKVTSDGRQPYFYDRSSVLWWQMHESCSSEEGMNYILYGAFDSSTSYFTNNTDGGGLRTIGNVHGWSHIVVPDKEKLVTDSGKLKMLDILLKRLKENEHRVLIYSQMTKMIDLLEEYMLLRKWKYIRLDGSSKIAERRDMVADFQSRSDIFVFLLSTRAGGLGINLTAADTVIFYDSDWNPTVDQQAMDRAHRLGQTKQVTVYRLICKGTVEERILQRAKEKNEIQRIVISGGHFRPDALKPKEVLSLLLDDEEIERKYCQKQAERKCTGVEKAVETKFSSSHRFSSKAVGSSSLNVFPGLVSNSTSHDQRYERMSKAVDSSLMNHLPLEESSGGSAEGSFPPSPDLSEDMESETRDIEFQEESGYDESIMDTNLSSSSYFDDYPRALEWNSGSVSDYDEDLSFIPKKPTIGRGTGKRGRPPSRVRVQMRDVEGHMPMRRGPGRPRLRPVGPANQGIRGRRPGRPPLSKKAETMSSSLTPLTPSQRVFGIYSSPDLNMS